MVTIGHIQSLAIGIWRTTPSPSAARSISQVIRQLLSTYSTVSAFHITSSAVGIPDSETRHVLGQLSKVVDGRLQALGVVVEVTGFKASVLQSIITGMLVPFRTRFPVGLHATREAGAAWMAQAFVAPFPPGPSSEHLINALDKFLAHTGPPKQPT